MTDQPEALRLADELKRPVGTQSTYSAMQQAAAELRRLHAEVERLRETARERGNRVIRKDKAIDALKDRNNGLKELIRTHRAEVERAEASVSVYMSERNQARDQIIAYRAEVERLRAVISNAAHKLEQQRVWGGMDWVYPAMHPRVWRAVLEQLDAALKETK